MSKHVMTVYVDRHERDYGYTYEHRLACSCGHMSQWLAGSDFERDVRLHKEQAVYDALGLEFSVMKVDNYA